MKISFIEMVGFRGAKNKIKLNFPSGFVVICGRNGSGKSTLCDAIEYALRGKIEKTYGSETEKGETISDYLWWRGAEKALDHYVTLGLIDDDGHELIIKRGPEGLISHQHKELEAALCLVDSSPDDCIDHLCQGSIIRDEMITNLSVDMPEAERFKFVKAAVTTSNFEMLEEKARKVVDILNERDSLAKQYYQETRNRVSELMAERSKMRAEAQQIEDTVKAEQVLRSLVSKPLPDVATLINEAKSLSVGLRQQVSGLAHILESMRGLDESRAKIETDAFKTQVTEMEAQIKEIEALFSEIAERNRELNDQIAAQGKLQPKLLSLSELASSGKHIGLDQGACPLCGLQISESDYFRHIEELERVVEAENKAMAMLIEERALISTKMNDLQNEISKKKVNFVHLSTTSNFILKQYEKIKAELRNYGMSLEADTSFDAAAIEKEIIMRRQKIIDIDNNLAILEVSKAIEKIIAIDRDIEIAQKKSLECERNIERVEKAASRAKILYSTIRRVAGEIVDEQLSALSPLFSELYFRLRPHIDWPEINYHIRGDVRRFLSLRVGDNLNLRFMFSSGQRRATGLAFLLSVNLSLGWSKLKSLILDDPVQHIDDYRALHLAEVLSSIRLLKNQVICTVEDAALADLLCRRLRSAEGDEGLLINTEYSVGEGIKILSERKIYPTPKEVLLSA